MTIPKSWRLTRKEKEDTLGKWKGRPIGIGEINYVEELVLQKVLKTLEDRDKGGKQRKKQSIYVKRAAKNLWSTRAADDNLTAQTAPIRPTAMKKERNGY